MTASVCARVIVAAAAGLLALTGMAAAQVQPSARIEYVEVVSSGFGGAGEPAKQGPIRRFVTQTPVHAVKIGTTFSMKVRTVGRPEGADVVLRFVWRAPRLEGQTNKFLRFKRMNAVEVPTKIGAEVERTFEFKEQWQIVSGTWRAEVWNGRRRLAMRRFAVK